MGESISRATDTIVEFCRENTDILMISGAAIAILIIVLAVIKTAVKKKDGDEQEFDEILIKEANYHEDKPSDKIPQDRNKDRRVEKEADTSVNREKNPTADSGANGAAEHTYTSVKANSRESLEAVLCEIAELSAKNLEEVEIKIQGAELKIRYSPVNRVNFTAEPENTGELPGAAEFTRTWNRNEAAAENDKTAGDVSDISIEEITREIENAMACETAAKEKSGEGSDIESAGNICEDEGAKTPARVKKFGPDNVDTSRSGRVFTEDELEKQIRD